MATQWGKRGHKIEAAVAALLAQPTIADAARSVGLGERTLRLWMRTDAFQALYRAARRQLVQHALGELQAAAGEAVGVLVRNTKAGRPADQIRAAATILRHVLQAEQLQELAERIEALERQAAGWDPQPGANGRCHR
jgi:hypothetical protein